MGAPAGGAFAGAYDANIEKATESILKVRAARVY
jgi:hypothetical protein